MKLTKSEINYIRTKILNKRWNAGSFNVNERRNFLHKMIERGLLTEQAQLTDKAVTLYHNQM